MSAQAPVEGIDPEFENPVDSSRWESEKTAASDDSEQTVHSQTKPLDVPPDGGYGWVCVVGAHISPHLLLGFTL
jgi:hypothetical protein